MPDRDSDEDLGRLVADLATTLRDLEEEVEPPSDRGLRPPSPRELRRFTSEVAIPGIILVLETNIRALRLLQRALQMAERGDQAREGVDEVGRRARSVSETTLDRLDDALVDLQAAIEGRPDNEEAARLLDDARRLREEVQTRLSEYSTEGDGDRDATESDGRAGDEESDDAVDSAGDAATDDADREPVSIDVDSELESIKREIDGDDAADVDGSDETEDDGANDSDADADSDDADGGA